MGKKAPAPNLAALGLLRSSGLEVVVPVDKVNLALFCLDHDGSGAGGQALTLVTLKRGTDPVDPAATVV
jgi:hypothetical protein